MNSKLASCHPGLQFRHLAAIALLWPSLLALSPSASHAAAGATTATCTYVNGVKKWVFRVDPAGVQSFQFTVTFDSARAKVNEDPGGGLIFKQPFNLTTLGVTPGVLVVSGETAQANVTPGDVDVFEIVFDDLQPLLPVSNAVFSVGGGAGDFIQTYDPDTNMSATITGSQVGPVSRFVTPGISPMVWDPDGAYNNGRTGGSGVWDLSATPRFDSLPTVVAGQTLADTAWSNSTNQHDIAVFGGNPGTGIVTVTGTISAGGFQFDMPGYHLSGGTVTLSAPAGSVPTIEIRQGTATVNTVLAGSAFTKTGPGTLIPTGANTSTGSTTIAGGTILISNDQNLGTAPLAPAPGALTLAGGTLQVTGTMTLNQNRGVALTPANGTVDVAPGGNLIYAGVIAGSGSLTKVGGGSVILSGNNTFTGGSTVVAGALVNEGSHLSGVTVLSGRLSGGGSIAGDVVIGDGTGAGDATISPVSAGMPATMTLGSLSLNSDAVFELTLDSTAAISGQLFVNEDVILGVRSRS